MSSEADLKRQCLSESCGLLDYAVIGPRHNRDLPIAERKDVGPVCRKCGGNVKPLTKMQREFLGRGG